MHNLNLLQSIAVWTLPVLLAIIVHEVAHGFVAKLLGDKTALMLGRLTLNPVKHIDLIGTIALPLLCIMTGSMMFGWAKAVPINPYNFKNFRQDSALVAIAGPIANGLMAILWCAVLKIVILVFPVGSNSVVNLFLLHVGYAGVSINLLLMVLNLVPIPPLDGSRIVASLLPLNFVKAYAAIEPYGFIILIILMYNNVLSLVIGSPIAWIQTSLFNIFAI